ncbi:MAG: hypothetical protein QG657_4519, partial [Acidobacteriota bacterium]|nr:hypothetical protein [Acidobacteriota bacterium]
QLVNYKSQASISFLFYTHSTDPIPAGNHVFTRFYHEMVLPQINRLNPDIIGMSICYEFQFPHAVFLGSQIKENNSSSFILIGGTHVQMLEEELLKGNNDLFSFADAYILGEGEIPTVTFLEAIQSGKKFAPIPKLFFKGQHHFEKTTGNVDLIPLTNLPLPDFTDLPLDRYLSPKTVIPYRVSRGCYWNKCAFCSHYQSRSFSFKKAEQVITDIKELTKRHHTDYIYFVDDALPKGFLEKFSDLSILENLDIKWLGNIRAEEFFTEALIKKMSQAGCKELYIGIESASQKLLDFIQKGITIDTVERIITDCHKHAISMKMNFIEGLPGEDHDDISQTVRFIKKNARNCDIICLTPLVVDSHTPLADNPQNFGLEIGHKKRSYSTALEFKRTSGILNDDIIHKLYSQDGDRINRFHFFSRIHHFLYTPRFSRKEFEQLEIQYFLLSDKIQNSAPPSKRQIHLDLTQIPYLKDYRFIPLNFCIDGENTELTDESLTAQKTYHIYSLQNFSYDYAFNETGYQLLSLCDGQNSIKNIASIFSNQQSATELQWENQIPEVLLHFYYKGYIDFHE